MYTGEYPGQYKNKFISHTFNTTEWAMAEITYDELNMSGLVVVSTELLPNNLAAIHTLYKNSDGTFDKKLIAIDRNYLECYTFV